MPCRLAETRRAAINHPFQGNLFPRAGAIFELALLLGAESLALREHVSKSSALRTLLSTPAATHVWYEGNVTPGVVILCAEWVPHMHVLEMEGDRGLKNMPEDMMWII